MYEHEDGDRIRRASAARTLGAPADEGDARALARQALQDSYDWRDDEPSAWTPLAAAKAANSAGPAAPDERSAAARAEARRGRQEIVPSISRTVAV